MSLFNFIPNRNPYKLSAYQCLSCESIFTRLNGYIAHLTTQKTCKPLQANGYKGMTQVTFFGIEENFSAWELIPNYKDTTDDQVLTDLEGKFDPQKRKPDLQDGNRNNQTFDEYAKVIGTLTPELIQIHQKNLRKHRLPDKPKSKEKDPFTPMYHSNWRELLESKSKKPFWMEENQDHFMEYNRFKSMLNKK